MSFMRLTYCIVAIYIAMLSTLSSANTSNLTHLKPFHTYYILRQDLGSSHGLLVQGKIKTDERTYKFTCQISSKNGTDISVENCDTGLISPDLPEIKTPWPQEITATIAQAEMAVEEHLDPLVGFGPAKADITMVHYQGFARRLAITEITPLDNEKELANRSSANADFILELPENGSARLVADKFRLERSYGQMCRIETSNAVKCSTIWNFVDFQLPDWAEGSSLLGVATIDPDSLPVEYRVAWGQFSQQALKTADAIASGEYSNPIESILEAQSDAVLPENFNQHLGFRISLDYETATERINRDVYILIPTRDLGGSQKTSYEYDDIPSGLTFTVVLDPIARRLQFITAANGDNQHKAALNYTLDATDHFVDGEKLAIISVSGRYETVFSNFATVSNALGLPIELMLTQVAYMSIVFNHPDSKAPVYIQTKRFRRN